MTRKVWMLIGLALVLGSLSLYLNRDRFRQKETIRIYDRSRPVNASRVRSRNAEQSSICPIVFGFGQALRLKSLKVIPLAATNRNVFVPPLWHLVSDSNSVPIKAFTYGQRIAGMRPAVKGVAPLPLEPGERYRLLIETAANQAQHDFVPLPALR